MTSVLIVGTVLAEIFTPQFAGWMFHGFTPAQMALTVHLTRILLPAQIFFYVGGVVSAVLLVASGCFCFRRWVRYALILLKILAQSDTEYRKGRWRMAGGGGSRLRQEVSRVKRLPVRWTAPGYADLFEILDFVAADRPDTARRLGRELLAQSRNR